MAIWPASSPTWWTGWTPAFAGPALSDTTARLVRGATGRIEGGGAGIAVASGHRLVQLELEGGPPVCAAPLRVGAEPEWLSELPAPLGICAETVQETFTQGRTQSGAKLLWRSIALKAATRRTGAKIFFADEARFPADGGLRARWVLKGEPALVDSTRAAIGRLKAGSRCNSHTNDRPRLRLPEHWPQGLVAGSSHEMTHSQTLHRTRPHRLFPTQIEHWAHWNSVVGQ